MNWYIESLSAVVNCFGYCNVLHSYRKPASPRARSSTFAAALPLLYCRLMGSFLHHTPNAVINRIKVRAIGWPHIRTSEFESFTTKQLHCFTYTISRLFVLLKDVFTSSNHRRCFGWLAAHQFISIVGSVDLCTRVYKSIDTRARIFLPFRVNTWKHRHVVNLLQKAL